MYAVQYRPGGVPFCTGRYFYVVNVYGAICLQIKKILDANSFFKSGNDEPFAISVCLMKTLNVKFS